MTFFSGNPFTFYSLLLKTSTENEPHSNIKEKETEAQFGGPSKGPPRVKL